MVASFSLFSGFRSVSTVPAGSFANAALVGANTVKGPGPDKVSTRPAALTAATSVVWSFELTALSTIVLVGYIAAPPTIGLAMASAGVSAVSASAASTGVKRIFVIGTSSFGPSSEKGAQDTRGDRQRMRRRRD